MHFTNPSEDVNTDGDDLWNLPGLSFYIVKEDFDPEIKEHMMQKLNKRFEMRDGYKKKDRFHFSPRLRVQNFLSEHTEGDEHWLQPPNGSKYFSHNNIPFNYVDPSQVEYSQPRGLHGFKISDDGGFGRNAPYYALSDFTTSTRIRSDDLGYPRFPIRKTNVSFIPTTEEGMQEDERTAGAATAEYHKFKDRDLNFRDLWWRSVEGGHFTQAAQRELSYGIVRDTQEHYRDFLLSYDYRLFGKSWLQPQFVENPLQNRAYEDDAAINS